MNKTITCVGLLFVIFSGIGIAAPTEKQVKKVLRAQFTTGLVDKEPVDQVVLLGNDITQVFYFTDLRHLSGQTITHQWEYQGDVISQMPIKIAGPRWRTNSNMMLDSSQLGKWTVLVKDESGRVLKATMFEYMPAGLARAVMSK